jgi:hypothetical protein
LAVFAIDGAPEDCAVRTVSVPHALPLQPGPEIDQFNALLGFELAAGVRVATNAAVVPGEMLLGPTSCKVKSLAMFRGKLADFAGSATLVAITVT